MRTSSSTLLVCLLIIVAIFLTGCTPGGALSFNSPPPTDTPTLIPTNTIEPSPTATLQPTHTATATEVPPTATPTLTPTPTWVYNEPGQVKAPILLYHHVYGDITTSRYQVSIPDFEAQMAALKEMGYTAIPISLLIKALLEGSELPEKPIVITFDDGHQSIYDNAMPIMQSYGFPGVFYIVANRINGSPDFVTAEQLKEMIEAGWEVGSHSYSHLDLTLNHNLADKEIGQSKTDLEYTLATKVLTFAYPYGTIDPFVAQKVSDFGYRAGMGLGRSKIHTWNTLFYLNRIEIYGEYTIDQFYEILKNE